MIPFAILYHVCKVNLAAIQSDQFQAKWGVLYSQIDLRSKLNLLHSLIFILRRILYVWLAFFALPFPGLQLILMNICNLFVMIFDRLNRPMKTRQLNQIETVNNSFVAISFITFMTFTNWGPDEETKYIVGWYLHLILLLIVVFNSYFALKLLIKSLRLRTIKYYRILRRKYLLRFKAKLDSIK